MHAHAPLVMQLLVSEPPHWKPCAPHFRNCCALTLIAWAFKPPIHIVMAKDKKAGNKGAAAPEAAGASVAECCWECAGCGQENEHVDEACCACDEPRPAAQSGEIRRSGRNRT